MAERNPGLYYLSLFLTAWVFFLLMAGGAVTSHEAGLAVPDWPLSYGQWFPPMVGNIFWEHGHRMIAGVAAILMLMTAVFVQMHEKRSWVRKLAWTAFAAVIVQALLGGLTVLMLLPPPVSIAHACLGQIFFCLVIALAYYLSPFSAATAADPVRENLRLRRLSRLTAIFLLLQLLLGAAVRHTGHVHTVAAHGVLAFIIAVHVVLLLVRVVKEYENRKFLVYLAVSAGVLTAIQIFLGLGSFVFTFMLERGYSPRLAEVLFTVAHQSTGALLLGLIVLMTLRVYPVPGRGNAN